MCEIYADVIIDISHEKLDKTFQYRVPDALAGEIDVGMCVQVPFGKGNTIRKGYVIGLGEECNFDPEKTKAIHALAKDKSHSCSGRR